MVHHLWGAVSWAVWISLHFWVDTDSVLKAVGGNHRLVASAEGKLRLQNFKRSKKWPEDLTACVKMIFCRSGSNQSSTPLLVLEGTLKIMYFQTPAMCRDTLTRLPQAPSRLAFNNSRVGTSTASLGDDEEPVFQLLIWKASSSEAQVLSGHH